MSTNGEAEPSESPQGTASAKLWNPDSALAALAEERSVLDVNVHDPLQIADAVGIVFRENAQMAALSIVHLSLHDPSPKVRLDASKYVIEAATRVAAGDKDPLMQLVSDLYKHLDHSQVAHGDGNDNDN